MRQTIIAHLLQSVEDVVWHVVLQHPLGDEDLVEVLVVGPDALVGWLPAPAPALGVMPHNVDDAAGRVQGLVDAAWRRSLEYSAYTRKQTD